MAEPLTPLEVALYSRQMLVPGFGPAAQRTLRGLRVLLVGAGGLGCPAALYLSRAGLAGLTIVDGDVVEASNLHRQVAHDASAVGAPKARSLAEACRRGLPAGCATAVEGVQAWLTAASAPALLRGHHLVLDASDNPATRYLVNDACALVPAAAGLPRPLPLISGAALGLDGQLSVHHWPSASGRGGCYRCTFPTPPSAAACPPCADAGVLGPVTGLVGTLMALEVFKCAAAWARGEGGGGPLCWGEGAHPAPLPCAPALHAPSLPSPAPSRLLCLDASEPRLRLLSTGAARPPCGLCAPHPTITTLEETVAWGQACGLSWAGFAGLPGQGPAEEAAAAAACPTATAAQIQQCRAGAGSAGAPLLLDVRPALQRDMCSPAVGHYAPLAQLQRVARERGVEALVAHLGELLGCAEQALRSGQAVLVLCRRGADSAVAVALLLQAGVAGAASIAGGLAEWNQGLSAGEACPEY